MVIHLIKRRKGIQIFFKFFFYFLILKILSIDFIYAGSLSQINRVEKDMQNHLMLKENGKIHYRLTKLKREYSSKKRKRGRTKSSVLRQRKNKRKARLNRKKNIHKKKKPTSSQHVTQTVNQLYSSYKRKKYMQVSEEAFRILMNPDFKSYRNSLRFLLGSSLYNLNFFQGASFQFANVIRDTQNKKLIRKNLTNLYLAANQLEDETLIHFSIAKINSKNFPKTHKDLLYLRVGEKYIKEKEFDQAIQVLKRISRRSSIYLKSKYLLGLAYSETKRNRSAIRAFNELYLLRSQTPKNDPIKTAALIGHARVLYQAKKWNQAIGMYSQVPKDTELWHDSLVERSWAFLRVGKFRSALSLLHSLHSTFYKNFYAPELLLLRSIVYLYICKYEEVEKTLDLYRNIYLKLQREIKLYLKNVSSFETYFMDTLRSVDAVKGGKLRLSRLAISPLLAFRIYKDGRLQDILKYIKNLKEEQKRLKSMPYRWQSASIGKYVEKILNIRISKSRRLAGKIIKQKMRDLEINLIDLSAQEGLIRFEMINSEKKAVKKIITKKTIGGQNIDRDKKRSFYVQNGYSYWPFRGEYWLDELGNYYYFGSSSCRK